MLAQAAMKWIMAQHNIDAVIVGAGTPEHLIANASALVHPEMTEAESAALATVRANGVFGAYREKKRAEFFV